MPVASPSPSPREAAPRPPRPRHRPGLLRHLAWLGLALGGLAWSAAAADSSPAVEDLVVVSEDLALNPAPGCDAVSVFSTAGEALYRSERVVSPGRLTGSPDLSLVLANHSNALQSEGGTPFLFALRRGPEGPGDWFKLGRVVGARFPARGGLALLPDGDSLLIGAAGESGDGSKLLPPFTLRKYRVSELGAGRLGPKRGEVEVDAPLVEVFPGQAGSLLHAVTERGTAYSLDAETLAPLAEPIAAPAFGGPGEAGTLLNLAQAAISRDGRWLATNVWEPPTLVLSDLVARRAVTRSLAAALSNVGGLAFNHADANADRLAVHGGDFVAVYAFDVRTGDTALLGGAAVAPLPIHPGAPWGPAPSIAWSGDGRHLIAATSEGAAEFRVFAVEEGGARLVPGPLLAACPDGLNRPNDILTTNLRPVPPTPPSPTTVPSPTPSPTPTETPLISPTPSDTPSPSATPSATPTPEGIYLPLALREERCQPERLQVDLALVIDASNSMGQGAGDGRTKLDTAREAARWMIDQIAPGRAGNQVALVSFNAAANLVQPLTTSNAALKRGLDAIRLDESTCIGCGIESARAELRGPRRRAGNDPVMIVLTDGRTNGETTETLLARAERARAEGIRIFSIGLGEDIDPAILAQIASQREYFYRAPSAVELVMIYQDIVREIPCPPEQFWSGRP